ncbi:MAG: PulJ/GspJ family protein [Planctomycetota bacterium]
MTNTHRPLSRPPHSLPRRLSGFTLAEVLLVSVLGAMLLTSLAVSTFGLTSNLDYLEDKAGVNSDIDPVLRRLTRDIREGWHVEKPAFNRLQIAEPDGDVTEYVFEDSTLKIIRPNGDEGVVLEDIQDVVFDVAKSTRKREGDVSDIDGVWHAKSLNGVTPLSVLVDSDDSLALSFVAPVAPKDISGSDDEEEVLAVQLSVLELPVAWVSGGPSHQFQVSLHEAWAPGKGRPYGNALASLSVPGSALPQAVAAVGGGYVVPSVDVPLALSAALDPGVGYTLVLKAQGSSSFVVAAGPHVPTVADDEVSLQASSGASWVTQALKVPFKLKGPFELTSTVQEEAISQVTITIYPNNRPLQQRSASVLSQVTFDDPWLGVVAGETAP